jgi:WD40 repeat protein
MPVTTEIQTVDGGDEFAKQSGARPKTIALDSKAFGDSLRVFRPGDRSARANSFTAFPGYSVRGELARGGMGVILEGLDPIVRRDLVIKVLRDDLASSPDAVARFIEEAQIQGQLEHPSICPVHELGVDALDRPFFAMKRVNGRSLQQMLREQLRGQGRKNEPHSLRELLGVFLKVCDAVAFAHSRGVVHRDLKPDNIMVGEFGEVLVMDWGIAKLLESEGDGSARVTSHRRDGSAFETRGGSVLGTPSYMSPEQASGQVAAVDERSDVYALCGVLYAILTLTPPIEGDDSKAALEKVRRNQIDRPSARAPHRKIPADLEAATMKGLAANRSDRYQSVTELRSEIVAFLEGRTLSAATYSFADIARKWAARHRSLAVAAAICAAVLLVGALVDVIQLTRSRRATEGALRQAEVRLAEGLVLQARALAIAERWKDARDRYVEAGKAFDKLAIAHPESDLGILETYHRAPPPLMEMRATDREIRALAITPDGRLALSGQDNTMKLWDIVTGRLVKTFNGPSPIWSVALSSDGKRAVSRDQNRTVVVWDVGSGQEIRRCGRPTGQTTRPEDFWGGPKLALSADGKQALVEDRDRGALLWDLERCDARPLTSYSPWWTSAVAMLKDASRAVVTRGYWWSTWGPLTASPSRTSHVVMWMRSAVLSSDGASFIVGGADGELSIYDAVSGRQKSKLLAHEGPVFGLAAGKQLALSGGQDGIVAVWNLQSSSRVLRLHGHRGPVYAVAMTEDERLAVSGGADGVVRVWRTIPDWNVGVLLEHRAGVASVALSPDGRLALINEGRAARAVLVDIGTGKVLRTLGGGAVGAVAFSPDGRVAAWFADHEGFHLSRLDDTRDALVIPLDRDRMEALQFSSDGRTLVAVGRDNTIGSWSVETGQEIHRFPAGGTRIQALALSPDGEVLATGDEDGYIALWRARDGHQIRNWRAANTSSHFGGRDGGFQSVAFSMDSKRVLSGSMDASLALWSVDDGRLVRSFTGQPEVIYSTALSADGQRAFSLGADHMLKVWDVSSGRQLHGFPTLARWMSVSRDGQMAILGTGHAEPWAKAVNLQLFEFGLPERYRAFAAQSGRNPSAFEQDVPPGTALKDLGAWYSFRGEWPLAIESLERARLRKIEVPSLELARAYWHLGKLADARREFANALVRGEAPAMYLRLCLEGINREVGAPPRDFLEVPLPSGTKLGQLRVMDTETANDWSVRRNLQAGDLVFSDRTYRLRQVSAALRGVDWVRPAAAAKFYQKDPIAVIFLAREADVFVAVEETFIPAWLDSGWERTTLNASFSGFGGVAVSTVIFKHRFPPGPVPLGPHGNPETGMYFVAIK